MPGGDGEAAGKHEVGEAEQGERRRAVSQSEACGEGFQAERR